MESERGRVEKRQRYEAYIPTIEKRSEGEKISLVSCVWCAHLCLLLSIGKTIPRGGSWSRVCQFYALTRRSVGRSVGRSSVVLRGIALVVFVLAMPSNRRVARVRREATAGASERAKPTSVWAITRCGVFRHRAKEANIHRARFGLCTRKKGFDTTRARPQR